MTCLSFWYHSFGDDDHFGDFEVLINTTKKEKMIWGHSGNKGDTWIQKHITILSVTPFRVTQLFITLIESKSQMRCTLFQGYAIYGYPVLLLSLGFSRFTFCCSVLFCFVLFRFVLLTVTCFVRLFFKVFVEFSLQFLLFCSVSFRFVNCELFP